MEDDISSKVLKFADDTKVFRKVTNDTDKQSLQDDLEKLVKWSQKWQMLLNFGKCKCIHIGHGNMDEEYKMGDLTRFAIQAKGPYGKWTRKPLAYRESNNVHLLIACPPEICVNLVFKHIHAASSYTICRQFVPFIYCPL